MAVQVEGNVPASTSTPPGRITSPARLPASIGRRRSVRFAPIVLAAALQVPVAGSNTSALLSVVATTVAGRGADSVRVRLDAAERDHVAEQRLPADDRRIHRNQREQFARSRHRAGGPREGLRRRVEDERRRSTTRPGTARIAARQQHLAAVVRDQRRALVHHPHSKVSARRGSASAGSQSGGRSVYVERECRSELWLR